MSDRFAWGAGDLTPDEVVESARLDEGRHSAGWREEDHPRAEDGKFGHSGGGSASGGDGSPAGGSNSAGGGRKSSGTRDAAEIPRGMPSVLASARVPGRNGTSFAMEHHADGGLTISDGHHSTKLSKYKASELMSILRNGNSDEMDIGEEWWVKGDSTFGADGERLTPRPLAMLARTGKDRYELKVADDNQTYDDIRASTGVTATENDLEKIRATHKRFAGATRVDTGNGDVDLFFTDDKKIGIRHLGDDGKPVEVAFKPRDFDKIADAVSVVIEGFDEMERFTKHPQGLADDEDFPAVSSVTFPTGAGKVRVELIGEWKGTNPGDRLRIGSAVDDSWAVIVDGPRQDAWHDAMDALEGADEEGDIYYRGIGWRGSEGTRRPRKPRNGQVSLTESAGGVALGKGRRFRARLIAGDVQGSSGYYSAGMLRKHSGVFRAGLPVYLDHPGVTEAYERPERSVRDLAGRLATTAVYEGDGLYADVEVYPHWAPVIEAMADDIGMSIRASGTVEASTVESIRGPIVTSLTEASSVDFVTAAGAGGKLVQLLESARAGNLAPPFKSKKDKAKDDEKPDDADGKNADDEDEEDAEDPKKKDGKKMPAFLKKILAKESDLFEAGTVGAGFESHIHSGFTQLADGMYGEGRLTRPERLTLSSAIGEALAAFTSRVEADQPHLYKRELWDEPEGADDETAMTENTDTTKGAPMSGSTMQDTPPERGTEVTESARVSELTTALAEARRVATALTEAQTAAAARLDDLETRLAESDAEKLDLTNDKAARTAVAEALKGSTLPAASHRRVTESVCRDLPTDDDGVLDTAKLGEAIKAAIDDKRAELAEALESAGVGSVRGLGESASREVSEDDIDKQLAEAFAGIGLDERAALTAAHGRA